MIISLNKTRIIRVLAITVPLALIAVVCGFIGKNTASPPPDSVRVKSIGKVSTAAETPEQEITFLNAFGISPIKNSRVCEDVEIPESFGEAYEKYNGIQKQTGFDLSDYRGRTACKTVYKTDKNKGTVTLLIIDGRVVGAHLSSGVYGEEYKPLNYGKTG